MLNEKEIPDSNIGIEYLCDYFKVDPYPGLSQCERGIARAFLKMIEENTAWSVFWYRYVEHIDEYINHMRLDEERQKTFPSYIKEYITTRATYHGIGRHSAEEIYKMGSDDIRAISGYLSDKKFLMGDHPTLVDCSLFGVLTQIAYVPMDFPMKTVLKEECQNVLELLERIKALYWSHWDSQSL